MGLVNNTTDWLSKVFEGLDKWVNPFDYPTGLVADEEILRWLPTGSFYICQPQVLDTDKDYVVLVKDLNKSQSKLQELGYKASISDSDEYDLEAEGGFMCYRKGDINLIVTEDEKFFLKFWEATVLAKQLNLKEKNDRIYLFKYVLYGTLGEE